MYRVSKSILLAVKKLRIDAITAICALLSSFDANHKDDIKHERGKM